MDDGNKPVEPKQFKKGFNWFITDWYDAAAIPVTIGLILLFKFIVGW